MSFEWVERHGAWSALGPAQVPGGPSGGRDTPSRGHLDGVDVLGYSPWSAIDLVSTHQGAAKRYGFVYVNREEFDLLDLARYRKDSFAWYAKVIASQGADLS